MRMTLCKMHLFNDHDCWTRQGYILNGRVWGENEVAEREIVWLQIGGGIANKFGCWIKYL